MHPASNNLVFSLNSDSHLIKCLDHEQQIGHKQIPGGMSQLQHKLESSNSITNRKGASTRVMDDCLHNLGRPCQPLSNVPQQVVLTCGTKEVLLVLQDVSLHQEHSRLDVSATAAYQLFLVATVR